MRNKVFALFVTGMLMMLLSGCKKDTCAIEGCINEVYKSGLCPDHYVQVNLMVNGDSTNNDSSSSGNINTTNIGTSAGDAGTSYDANASSNETKTVHEAYLDEICKISNDIVSDVEISSVYLDVKKYAICIRNNGHKAIPLPTGNDWLIVMKNGVDEYVPSLITEKGIKSFVIKEGDVLNPNEKIYLVPECDAIPEFINSTSTFMYELTFNANLYGEDFVLHLVTKEDAKKGSGSKKNQAASNNSSNNNSLGKVEITQNELNQLSEMSSRFYDDVSKLYDIQKVSYSACVINGNDAIIYINYDYGFGNAQYVMTKVPKSNGVTDIYSIELFDYLTYFDSEDQWLVIYGYEGMKQDIHFFHYDTDLNKLRYDLVVNYDIDTMEYSYSLTNVNGETITTTDRKKAEDFIKQNIGPNAVYFNDEGAVFLKGDGPVLYSSIEEAIKNAQ